MDSGVQNEHNRRILSAIASGARVTQRSLAAQLGIALGLANSLVHRLVKKGYVRVTRISTRHVKYFLTKEGRDALTAATHQSLANTIHLYTQTRQLIRASLDEASRRIVPVPHRGKRVVFYGAGDVAEIAFISLQGTDLELVGVVDDFRQGMFLGYPIQPPSALNAQNLGGVPFDAVVVVTVKDADHILVRLAERQFPAARVFFI